MLPARMHRAAADFPRFSMRGKLATARAQADASRLAVFYVFRSDIGNWVINGGGDCPQIVELYWYAPDGSSERAGRYHSVNHATGAVRWQVTGLDCWDLLQQIPERIDDPASWDEVDHYP
jgi:hypothetical protein